MDNFDLEAAIAASAKIKVFGVGGGGNNAVNRMIDAGIKSAQFVAVNTDKQILFASKAQKTIQIGEKLTKGLGAGADPSVGEKAAEESKSALLEELQDVDLLFIAAGMGGGTGTGAAPIIARMSKELGILTVAVVTKPFLFEGRRRMVNAEQGIEKLEQYVDTLLVIPNEKLLQVVPKGTPVVEAFKQADEVLRKGIQGIADLIATPSLINLDFADVRSVMKDTGLAHMGIGEGTGENKTIDAVRQAVASPLLDSNIEGATGVILNVTGGLDLALDEVTQACSLVQEVVDISANIIFGAGIDETMEDKVAVTLIATGFEGGKSAVKETPAAEPVKAEEPVARVAAAVEERPHQEEVSLRDRYKPVRSFEQPAPEERHEPVRDSRPAANDDFDDTFKPAYEPARKENTSRISMDEKDLPSFIKKIRNNRK